jgi:hypothetical protein
VGRSIAPFNALQLQISPVSNGTRHHPTKNFPCSAGRAQRAIKPTKQVASMPYLSKQSLYMTLMMVSFLPIRFTDWPTPQQSMSACFRHTNLPHRPHAKLGAPLVKLHKKSPGKSSVVPTVRVDGFQIKPLSL